MHGEGTRPVHAHRQRDKDHAEDPPAARQDLRRRQGDDPGVRVGVHKLHHRGSQRALPEGAEEDHHRRGRAVGYEQAWVRRLHRAADDVPAPVQGHGGRAKYHERRRRAADEEGGG